MDLTPNINKQKGTYGMTFLNCDFINFNDVSIEYVLFFGFLKIIIATLIAPNGNSQWPCEEGNMYKFFKLEALKK